MRKDRSKDDALLVKSERWIYRKRGKSKLEKARSAIFNLRYNKRLSYTVIRHFLSEEGIRTSTAALSSFCRSRFTPEIVERVKLAIISRLAELAPSAASGTKRQ